MQKGLGGMDKGIEHLPSKCKALGSTPVPPKKERKYFK
jgi:hypothetical protein